MKTRKYFKTQIEDFALISRTKKKIFLHSFHCSLKTQTHIRMHNLIVLVNIKIVFFILIKKCDLNIHK